MSSFLLSLDSHHVELHAKGVVLVLKLTGDVFAKGKQVYALPALYLEPQARVGFAVRTVTMCPSLCCLNNRAEDRLFRASSYLSSREISIKRFTQFRLLATRHASPNSAYDESDLDRAIYGQESVESGIQAWYAAITVSSLLKVSSTTFSRARERRIM